MKKQLLICLLTTLISTTSLAQTVKIGSQVWTKKNLNVSTFRNGDPIPEAKTNAEWEKAWRNKQPAWCYYDNDAANGRKYGKLYNWYAVNDVRGLAPAGYHIPTDGEWTTLTDHLGGLSAAGKKMKSKKGWSKSYKGKSVKGTNSSGFGGLPGGYRNNLDEFSYIGSWASWWSATVFNQANVWEFALESDNGVVYRDRSHPRVGLSVRCIKD